MVDDTTRSGGDGVLADGGDGVTADGGDGTTAGGSGKRPYRSREERRTEIVEATLSILAEQGMHAWTTSALAERVGCSEATLFKHFESKDEILTEALRRQAAALRRLVSEYRGRGSGWARTRGLVLQVLEAVREAGGGPLVILLGQASRIHPEMGREAQETMAFFRHRIESLLAEDGTPAEGGMSAEGRASAEGRTSAERGASGNGGVDPSLLAQLVMAVAHSSALRWMVSDRSGSPAAVARPLLDELGKLAVGEAVGEPIGEPIGEAVGEEEG